jgi:hypothetical protein
VVLNQLLCSFNTWCFFRQTYSQIIIGRGWDMVVMVVAMVMLWGQQ